MLRTVKIKTYQIGLLFIENEFQGFLEKGKHTIYKPFKEGYIEIVSELNPWLSHEKLDLIIKHEDAEKYLEIIELKDNERALVWIDNRFKNILNAGNYALFKTAKNIRVEKLDANDIKFEHKDLNIILKASNTSILLEVFDVLEGFTGLYFLDGKFISELKPGRYAFWKGLGKIKLYHIDLRDKVMDVTGQEIMTNDKVTLRINAVLAYRVKDALKSVLKNEDIHQALYRDTQLALRAIVGTKELDDLLTEKDTVLTELEEMIKKSTKEYGVELVNAGIKDIILPGEMKDLLNKVTEAKKAAEANLISRREEVAAIRSQLNTAKLLKDHPTLMRLKELEILEKIASYSKLNVVLGNEKLSEKITNLL